MCLIRLDSSSHHILYCFVFLTILRAPRSPRTDTLIPYTTLLRSPSPPTWICPPPPGTTTKAEMGLDQAIWWATTGVLAGSLAFAADLVLPATARRSEEHTSELQSLMRRSYAVLRLKKKKSIDRPQTSQHVT